MSFIAARDDRPPRLVHGSVASSSVITATTQYREIFGQLKALSASASIDCGTRHSHAAVNGHANRGDPCSSFGKPMTPRPHVLHPYPDACFLRHSLFIRAVCVDALVWICAGRSVMIVPTATAIRKPSEESRQTQRSFAPFSLNAECPQSRFFLPGFVFSPSVFDIRGNHQGSALPGTSCKVRRIPATNPFTQGRSDKNSRCSSIVV